MQRLRDLSRAAVGPLNLTLQAAPAEARASLETFIAERFAAAHGARLRRFMPELFALLGPGGGIVAAFGLRAAGQAPLFLETYLDEPVEAALARQVQRPVDRTRVVEIGHLAGTSPGALRALIPLLCAQLQARGLHFAVFTAPAQLANAFSKLALPLRVLAPAAPNRLPPAERADWGRYYEHAPCVLCGDIAETARRLRTPGAEASATTPQCAAGECP